MAVCAQDVTTMYPDDGDTRGVIIAKTRCNRCPVRNHCLAEALLKREGFGIWGGQTERERRKLLAYMPVVIPSHLTESLTG